MNAMPASVSSVALEMNLLLVSRSPRWTLAVHEAAESIGGLAVSPCGARDALARLAVAAEQYSHLLVEHESADGLLDVLMDMAAETTGVDTEMFMLGETTAVRPHIGVIRCANTSAVREALMPRPPLSGDKQSAMQPTELRDALAGSMIEPRYQPIVRIADRKPMALEALARLNHPVRGTLLPDRFVPQIEDAGLAPELTEIISERAFADMTGPSLAGRGLAITLNFPLDVLLMPAALARLEVQRLAYGIPAERVIIELTESRPVEDFVALRGPLEHLRKLGYRVAIDDVGPAVPGLAQLLELPFTSLKLDKELVQRVEDNAEIASVLGDVVYQAHRRGLIVVAEGVETTSLWHHMQALGADEAQGFLVARPLPVAAVPVWLESWLGVPGSED
jgi:EAL domain-containing protein (putative c-di-GMP-specific phosphodiesterase class I)